MKMKCSQRVFPLVVLLLFVKMTSSFRLRTPANLTKKIGEGSPSTRGGSHGDKKKDKDAANNETERKQVILVIEPKWARFLYGLSVLNPIIAVIFNDYTKMLEVIPGLQTQPSQNIIAKTVEGVFVFARLNPRVSFAVGGLLRALQLTTAFQYVINPSSGVGFGLNLICYFAKSRWPATVFLGWSITEPVWKILGAHPPQSSPVPITINFNNNSSKSNKNKEYKNTSEPRHQVGYRIGL